ncbi:MAG: polysaccharide deacetylase family protein [Actinomycetota bacterium]|nr:polysaccharide deacetylase family protein [Actinomycetota bacterium]
MSVRGALLVALSFLRRALDRSREAVDPIPSLPTVLVLLVSVGLLAAAPALQAIPGWATPAGFAIAGSPPPPEPVDGLDMRLAYRSDPGAAVGARWAEIPGNPAFNGELRRAVKEAIDAQGTATGIPFAPAADAPAGHLSTQTCAPEATTRPAVELLRDPGLSPQTGGPTVTVVCEIVAASGSVLGEALRIVTASGGQVLADTTTVYFADSSTGFLGGSDGLLTDDGVRMLFTGLLKAVQAPEAPDAPAALPLPQLRAWLANLTFAHDGSLVLRLPRGFATTELPGLAAAAEPAPLVVTVGALHARDLLTDLGKRVQAALGSSDRLVLPGAHPSGHEEMDCTLVACVALTFDDGPGPHTAAVLDALAARRAPATFFLQGFHAERYPDLVRRMHAEGHQIGNHTWNHADLTTLPGAAVAEQIQRTNDVIGAIIGAPPTTFRPPYGAFNDDVLGHAAMPAILWSLDTKDWRKPGDAAVLERTVAGSQPGDIVLLHDVHESTARVTPQIIEGLIQRGFTLVTVEQLLGGTPEPGTATRR